MGWKKRPEKKQQVKMAHIDSDKNLLFVYDDNNQHWSWSGIQEYKKYLESDLGNKVIIVPKSMLLTHIASITGKEYAMIQNIIKKARKVDGKED